MVRSIESEARRYREMIAAHLKSEAEMLAIAAWWETPTSAAVRDLLILQIRQWEIGGAWGDLDGNATREQGKALRSRELLEYFKGASEAATTHRSEAERLSRLLEAAADAGRIARS